METNPRDPVALQRTAEEASAKTGTSSVPARAGEPALKRTRVRYGILALLFFGVVINYLDRANLALAAPVIKNDLHMNAATLGAVLAAFGFSYAFMQIPGGFVIDRLGPRITYGVALTVWSIITALQGLARSAVVLIGLRIGLGIAEAPAFPVNSRVVAAWFPNKERASAVGIYTAGEFVGLAFLTPVLAWLLTSFGWPLMFALSGLLGLIFAGLWLASSIVFANYVESINAVIAIMTLAFFGQGMSAISWTLVSDTAPKELLGLAGGVFNFFANLGSIVTPLAIGFILAATNSFSGGLVFMSAVALVGMLS